MDREVGGTATFERGAVCNLVEVRISAETGLNVVSGKSTGRDEGGEGSIVLALRNKLRFELGSTQAEAVRLQFY